MSLVIGYGLATSSQKFAELCELACMLGGLGEVAVLVRVGLHVIELFGLILIACVVPVWCAK